MENTATPFLDNFDEEFNSPDFGNKAVNKENPFDMFDKVEKSKNETPFDDFMGGKGVVKKEEGILEKVMSPDFLNTNDHSNAIKTPFD